MSHDASERSRLRRWGLLAAALGLGLVAALGAGSASADEDEAFARAKGRVTYRVYCINCHGAKAEGDGSLAELLTVKPADLTRLQENNGGRFPTDRLREAIDGRRDVRGHGRREMPVWGDVFQTSGLGLTEDDEEPESRAKRKIDEVLLYLRSIQVPAAQPAQQ